MSVLVTNRMKSCNFLGLVGKDMAGIIFGFCDGASVSWKVEKAQVRVGIGLWGLANVTLIVTRTTRYPSWYNNPDFQHLRAWIDSILCDDTHMPDTATIAATVARMYRWKPKRVDVGNQEVVNYNSPCNIHLAREKPIRSTLSAGISGLGAIEKIRFKNSLAWAEEAINEVSQVVTGETVSFDNFKWIEGACENVRSINSWERYSTTWRASGPPPCTLPRWTSLSITTDNLRTPSLSLLSVSETIYYTDQSPTVVDIDQVVDILLNRADLTDCPR